MDRRLYILLLFIAGAMFKLQAQHPYYKSPSRDAVMEFRDSARRAMLVRMDSTNILQHQVDYILRFFPTTRAKKIYVAYVRSSRPYFTKPKFGAIFKSPEEREYKILFSRSTGSTLDSVTLPHLSFNAQLGLIGMQIAQVEDFSTDGFFDMLAWHFRRLYRKGRNKTYQNNEEKMMEVGLGYQLLALNRELADNLSIEKWSNTKGYTRYARQMRGQAMQPEFILNFISDLPVYVGKVYK